MEIKNVKTLIENKLACIDIENKNTNGEVTMTRWQNELKGIKQVLQVMGFNLELDVNPYFYENKEPSTYKISFEE